MLSRRMKYILTNESSKVLHNYSNGFQKRNRDSILLLLILEFIIIGLNNLLNIYLQPRNQLVACDDPEISKPLVMDYEWIGGYYAPFTWLCITCL